MSRALLSCGSLIVFSALVSIGCGSDSKDGSGTNATGGAGNSATGTTSAGGADNQSTSKPKDGSSSGGAPSTSKTGNGGSGTKATASNGTGGSSEASGSVQLGGASNSGSKSKGGSNPQGGTAPGSSSGGQTGGVGAGGSSSGSKSSSAPTTGGNGAVCTSFGQYAANGTLQSDTVDDSILKQTSGIVESREQPGVVYTQTDSGKAEIYVVDETGKALGTLTLNVTPVDWEDLSMGIVADGPDLVYVADIGDNNSNRKSIVVYRFEEPNKSALSPSTPVAITKVESATLVYPSGAKNAEALFIDPKTQDIIIATKDQGTSTVYRAPITAFGGTSTTLEEVGKISMNSQISAGDISPSGELIIFRTYDSMLLFPRLGTWKETFAATGITISAPAKKDDPQSEGVTFTSDGTAWLSAGEQTLTIYKGVANCK